MDIQSVGVAMNHGIMITMLVALIKALYPGSMSAQNVRAAVLGASVVVVGVSVISGVTPYTTPYDLMAQVIMYASSAIGIREGVSGIPVVGKTLANLPTNNGTNP